MSIYNNVFNGTFIYYYNSIGYFFNKKNNLKIKDIYETLASCFKSMFCLISKPVFIFKTDKTIIQLYFYLAIPVFLLPTNASKLLRYPGRPFNLSVTGKKRRLVIIILVIDLRLILSGQITLGLFLLFQECLGLKELI